MYVRGLGRLSYPAIQSCMLIGPAPGEPLANQVNLLIDSFHLSRDIWYAVWYTDELDIGIDPNDRACKSNRRQNSVVTADL